MGAECGFFPGPGTASGKQEATWCFITCLWLLVWGGGVSLRSPCRLSPGKFNFLYLTQSSSCRQPRDLRGCRVLSTLQAGGFASGFQQPLSSRSPGLRCLLVSETQASEPPAAGRGRQGFLPRASRACSVLLTPGFWMPARGKSKRVRFCCLKQGECRGLMGT